MNKSKKFFCFIFIFASILFLPNLAFANELSEENLIINNEILSEDITSKDNEINDEIKSENSDFYESESETEEDIKINSDNNLQKSDDAVDKNVNIQSEEETSIEGLNEETLNEKLNEETLNEKVNEETLSEKSNEEIAVKGFLTNDTSIRTEPDGEIIGIAKKDTLISGKKESNGWIKLDNGNYIFVEDLTETIPVRGFVPVLTNVRTIPNGKIIGTQQKDSLISGIKETNGWIKLDNGNYIWDFGLLDTIKVKGFITVSTNVRTSPNGKIVRVEQKETLISGTKEANGWIKLDSGNYIWDFGLLDTIKVKGFVSVSTNVRTSPNGNIVRTEAKDALISGTKSINGWIKLDKGNYLFDFGLKSTIPAEGYISSTMNLREKPNGKILGTINAGMYLHGKLTANNYIITVGPTNSGKKTVYIYNYGLYKKHHKGYTRMSLNLRSDASLSSKIIGTIPSGTYINKFSNSDWVKYGNGYVNARTVVATVSNNFKNTKYLYTVDGNVPSVIDGRKLTGTLVDPNVTTTLTNSQINERIITLPNYLKNGVASNPLAKNTYVKFRDYKGYSTETNLDYDYQNALKTSRKVKVPYIVQFDERWGFENMNGKYSDYIANVGCGPAVLTMIYSYFTGDTSLDVKDMTEISVANGWTTGFTSYSYMFTSAPRMFGLSSYITTRSVANVKSQLNAGRLLVAYVGPGDFTSSGHFIILSEYSGNNVKIYDPADYSFTNRVWSIQRILNQTYTLYSIGY